MNRGPLGAFFVSCQSAGGQLTGYMERGSLAGAAPGVSPSTELQSFFRIFYIRFIGRTNKIKLNEYEAQPALIYFFNIPNNTT
jgi:hypothetical protein